MVPKKSFFTRDQMGKDYPMKFLQTRYHHGRVLRTWIEYDPITDLTLRGLEKLGQLQHETGLRGGALRLEFNRHYHPNKVPPAMRIKRVRKDDLLIEGSLSVASVPQGSVKTTGYYQGMTDAGQEATLPIFTARDYLDNTITSKSYKSASMWLKRGNEVLESRFMRKFGYAKSIKDIVADQELSLVAV